MMNRGTCFAIAMLAVFSGQASALEPESGIFGGPEITEPYEFELRRSLLDADSYRLCQLLAVPSFSEEWAVYMLHADAPGSGYTVVSRRMKDSLWGAMMSEIMKGQHGSSYNMGASAQAKALKAVHVDTLTHSVPLDPSLARRMDRACAGVLRRTRYPETPDHGLDGTTYHAGHWLVGQFLGGKTWSPEPGTLDGDFVALETSLQAYAESASANRKRATEDLTHALDRVEQQIAKLSKPPDASPGKPRT